MFSQRKTVSSFIKCAHTEIMKKKSEEEFVFIAVFCAAHNKLKI